VWDTTEGFFSRWVVVPFSAFFPAGKADPSLVERLTRPEVLRGLLRGAVGGLQSVMRRGQFQLPPSVISATERFKTEADPMRGFIEERIECRHPNNAPFVARQDFYLAYSTWASINGFHVMSAQRFYESFVAAGTGVWEYPLRVITLHGTQGYKGIALK
jgi:putative DNA primase/helicase